MIDAIAGEPHFLDHIAPVWSLLPAPVRGRFHVDPTLVERAAARGITAVPLDMDSLRRTSQAGPVHDGIPTLVASIGDIKIGRRLGHGPFVFLEHGAGQAYDLRNANDASYAGGPDRDDNEVFLVPNEYSASRWRRAYPRARVEVVGSPRLDGLPQREPGPGPVVAVSFHGDWPRGAYGGTALHDGYAEVLPLLAARWPVIGHAHPGKGWGDRMARLFARHGIEFVRDFDDVCRRADLYVCDNSSTIFEFASTGRPVVLMNARHWSRKAGPGLRFWDAAHVGLQVDRPEDLVGAVEISLGSPDGRTGRELKRRREHALRFVYAQRRGAATRAAAIVADWAESRARVAA